MSKTKLMLGDNIESLKKLPDNSVDSIVSDPPYGLSFMNKRWDYDVPSVEFWKEVLRVLKPGGHVLSFGGTRTYHRMVVNIEDAGFEIRDQIMWLYGSGFPKSHNIGKAVDKGDKSFYDNAWASSDVSRKDVEITKGQSPYEGWGTALKPAVEPICVARKPLSEKSVAENVLRWGTGGINIDGCRVGSETIKVNGGGRTHYDGRDNPGWNNPTPTENEGRFPANIILECLCDEVIKGEKGEVIKSDIHTNPMCPCLLLDEQSGISKSSPTPSHKRKGNVVADERTSKAAGMFGDGNILYGSNHNDKGGASRFFYQAKVSKQERNMGLDGFEVEILTPTIKLLLKTDYNNKNFIWEKEDLQTELVDTDKLQQKDIEEYITTEDNKWNTELFGNIITEQFLMDAKSIIETKTNSITIYQTLNLLIQANIKKNIQELLGKTESDIKFVENVEKKSTIVYITYQNKVGLNPSVNPVLLEEQWIINIKENKCSHPTLKPVSLMAYLCRLVTPVNGIVLDPFMGSGSTGIAARLEGFKFLGMELDKDYFKIAESRIQNFEEYRKFLKK